MNVRQVLESDAINISWLAREMKISKQYLHNKIKGNQGKTLTGEDLAKIERILIFMLHS